MSDGLRRSLYHRVFAALMARGGERYERLVQDKKADLLSAVSGTVVEIGAGTGPNLRFAERVDMWLGVEPNVHMYPYFVREAAAHEVRAFPLPGVASALPLADDSADWVVSTLVLCSVPDLDGALREIRRVLRPEGRFLFVEHVAAPAESWLRRLQRFVRPAWKLVGDGCRPDRETEAAIRNAGFRAVEVERFRVAVPVVAPHVVGVAWNDPGSP